MSKSKDIHLSSFDENNQKKIKNALENGQEIIVEYEEDSDQYSDYQFPSDWISDYCFNEGIDCFADIPEQFMKNDENFSGLEMLVPHYEIALKLLRGEIKEKVAYDEEIDLSILMLFSFIHQRYVVTREGLEDIFDNYQAGYYGQCPRLACKGQHMLPHGVSADYNVGHLMVFCPCCKDLYFPANPALRKIDGCAFGPEFVPNFVKAYYNRMGVKPCNNFKFTVKGFKLSEKKRRLNREMYNE